MKPFKLYPCTTLFAVMGVYKLCPKILPHLAIGVLTFIVIALVMVIAEKVENLILSKFKKP